MNGKEKANFRSLLSIWFVRIIRGGDSNPTNFAKATIDWYKNEGWL